MKELDVLLVGWLDREYARAGEAIRALFAEFLELPDPLIARYLLGREAPEPRYAELVRALTAARD